MTTTDTATEEQTAQPRRRGYQGLACPCAKCALLTPQEREAKQERIQAARRQGGKTRAAQESFVDACRTGFEVTLERHPFFARKYLKRKIKAQDRARAARSLQSAATS